VRDLWKADGDCYPLAGRPAVSVLQKRVEALEACEAALQSSAELSLGGRA
jgi:hypothetical protein